jgi:hypothetical protein
LLIKYRAAAGRQNHVIAPDQFADCRRFTLAKPGFTFDIEYVRDRHAGALDDFFIAVDKHLTQMFGQLPPHGRLARAHHANQDKVAGREFAAIVRAAAILTTVLLIALHVSHCNRKKQKPGLAGLFYTPFLIEIYRFGLLVATLRHYLGKLKATRDQARLNASSSRPG